MKKYLETIIGKIDADTEEEMEQEPNEFEREAQINLSLLRELFVNDDAFNAFWQDCASFSKAQMKPANLC
jgi:ribosomal protein S6